MGIHAGLQYFQVRLFERDNLGNVTRNLINIGCHAAFLTYVLLLPRLSQRRYVEAVEQSWTMVGHEYERLAEDGNLQTVYSLPINLQQRMEQPVHVNNPQENDWQDDAIHEDLSVAYV